MKIKVFRLSHYATSSEKSKNRTGLGRTVWDLSRWSNIAGMDSILFTYIHDNDELKDGVKIIKHRPSDLINSRGITDFLKVWFLISSKDLKNIKKLKLLKFFLYINVIKKTINLERPQIIHIHGITLTTIPFIIASIQSKSPFIVTLHGLNLENEILSDFEKNIEKKAIEYLNQKGVLMTAVSSGVKMKIINNYNIRYPENIYVVSNGVEKTLISDKSINNNFRKELGINIGEKILLSIGKLDKNKNHKMVIEAISKLPNNLRSNLRYYIIGEGEEMTNLKKLVSTKKLSKTVYLVGYKEKEELKEYLYIADLLVSTSNYEGFGRPFLEAYAFGVPVLTFSDLEAIPDLYDPSCMELVNIRSSKELSNGIISALEKKWVKEDIQNKARSFTWDNIINQYEKIYALKHPTLENYKEFVSRVIK